MQLIKAREAVVCWSPFFGVLSEAHEGTRGRMLIMQRPHKPPSAEVLAKLSQYLYVDLASWNSVEAETDLQVLARIHDIFVKTVIRDGIDPQLVHKTLCQIDLYHQRLSMDMLTAR